MLIEIRFYWWVLCVQDIRLPFSFLISVLWCIPVGGGGEISSHNRHKTTTSCWFSAFPTLFLWGAAAKWLCGFKQTNRSPKTLRVDPENTNRLWPCLSAPSTQHDTVMPFNSALWSTARTIRVTIPSCCRHTGWRKSAQHLRCSAGCPAVWFSDAK